VYASISPTLGLELLYGENDITLELRPGSSFFNYQDFASQFLELVGACNIRKMKALTLPADIPIYSLEFEGFFHSSPDHLSLRGMLKSYAGLRNLTQLTIDIDLVLHIGFQQLKHGEPAQTTIIDVTDRQGYVDLVDATPGFLNAIRIRDVNSVNDVIFRINGSLFGRAALQTVIIIREYCANLKFTHECGCGALRQVIFSSSKLPVAKDDEQKDIVGGWDDDGNQES
jgi:hypothetical protein